MGTQQQAGRKTVILASGAIATGSSGVHMSMSRSCHSSLDALGAASAADAGGELPLRESCLNDARRSLSCSQLDQLGKLSANDEAQERFNKMRDAMRECRLQGLRLGMQSAASIRQR